MLEIWYGDEIKTSIMGCLRSTFNPTKYAIAGRALVPRAFYWTGA